MPVGNRIHNIMVLNCAKLYSTEKRFIFLLTGMFALWGS